MLDILITIVVTVAITWPVAHHYARKSSKEIMLILESLEQGGLVQYTRDANGKIQGRIVTGAADIKSKSSFTASSE